MHPSLKLRKPHDLLQLTCVRCSIHRRAPYRCLVPKAVRASTPSPTAVAASNPVGNTFRAAILASADVAMPGPYIRTCAFQGSCGRAGHQAQYCVVRCCVERANWPKPCTANHPCQGQPPPITRPNTLANISHGGPSPFITHANPLSTSLAYVVHRAGLA